MDRLTSMAVFAAAVDEGSLAAAARRFGLSPAMAGKHVSAIEADLQARLLQRTTRRLALTEAGAAYYARCRRILEEFDDARREAADAQHTPRGTLRIAAPVTFGALHLGGVIARYVERNPEVNLEIVLSDGFANLLEEAIDVAIRIGRLPDSELVARRLARCRMVACAAPAYLARRGAPKTPEALREHPRLAFSDAVSAGDWTFFDRDGAAHRVDGRVSIAANNMQMLLAAAVAGAGVAFGPSFVFGDALRKGELVALLPDYGTADLTIQAVFPSARHLPLKVRRFVDALAEEWGNEPPWDQME
ncbi:LysR family transcriptional regulator [Trinickia terrae]|uniref:LysR family transcriptional regulator n=1 Tax=Trinickia terrae TaxID=2571161 RepID=A0A4U1I740_9BURK|nr:LysR family transcriptional regulator [Trinickia terrae]TKC89213.1 LysR family transcriptional regulator [Trinickia terrae]